MKKERRQRSGIDKSSTTPDPGYHMGSNKNTINIKSPALSQQATTRQQWADAKALKTQDTKNTNDPQKKYRLGTVSKNILLEA